MTSRVRLSAAAQRDIAAVKEWYAKRPTPDLDLRFQQELEKVFQQVGRFPASYSVVYKDVRRAILNRFPYAVFYHLRNDSPYILAVVHQARDPRVWKLRS